MISSRLSSTYRLCVPLVVRNLPQNSGKIAQVARCSLTHARFMHASKTFKQSPNLPPQPERNFGAIWDIGTCVAITGIGLYSIYCFEQNRGNDETELEKANTLSFSLVARHISRDNRPLNTMWKEIGGDISSRSFSLTYQALLLIQSGKYNSATEILTEALCSIQDNSPIKKLLLLLRADCYRILCKYSKAQKDTNSALLIGSSNSFFTEISWKIYNELNQVQKNADLASSRFEDPLSLGHEQDPQNSFWLAHLGAYYYTKMENKDRAKEYADRAIQSFSSAYFQFSLPFSLRAKIALEENKAPEAINYGLKAISINPDDQEALKTLILAYKKIGENQKALQFIGTLLKKKPTQDIKNFFGNILYEFRDSKEVEILFERAFVLIPCHPATLLLQTRLLMQNREYEEALTIAQKIIDTPSNPKELINGSYLLQAEILYKLNNRVGAENLLYSLLEKDQKNIPALCLLAIKIAENPNSLRPRELLKQALSIDPANIEVRLLQVRLSLRDGLYKEALVQIQEILKEQPKHEEALILLVEYSEPETAKATYQRILQLYPHNSQALCYEAENHLTAGEWDRAIELFSQCLNAEKLSEKTKDEALKLRALAYLRKNNIAEARKDIMKISKSSKSYGNAKFMEGD
jgi:tetratricopeptide (TPR) repeat protein